MISLESIKNVHFVGIGGISMSGLAHILLNSGYTVTGSDINDSSIITKLKEKGARIFMSHDSKNVEGAELIVYTTAVKQDNCEIVRAKELGIPIVDRAEFLGMIMKKYSYGIAIAGSHGKTTVTSMVSIIFKNADKDPTALIGGEIEAIGGNVRVGNSKYFITEACEYFENFLKFSPFVAAILNVERDHLDYYKDLDHIMSAFEKFARLVPKDGCLVVCSDNENAMKISAKLECKVLTYGIKNKADFYARNIRYDNLGHSTFEVMHRHKKLRTISMNVPGEHNVLNALASITIAYNAGIDMKIIKKSLCEFKGTHRRFDITGSRNSITVVDDYAHHPTEIKATLHAAKQFPHQKIWCIFQPHTYTRTKTLFEEFSEAFYDADRVIITDIYAAREKDVGLVNPAELVESINKYSANAEYKTDFKSIANFIAHEAQPGDLIFTMGAGDVFKLGPMILDELKA